MYTARTYAVFTAPLRELICGMEDATIARNAENYFDFCADVIECGSEIVRDGICHPYKFRSLSSNPEFMEGRWPIDAVHSCFMVLLQHRDDIIDTEHVNLDEILQILRAKHRIAASFVEGRAMWNCLTLRSIVFLFRWDVEFFLPFRDSEHKNDIIAHLAAWLAVTLAENHAKILELGGLPGIREACISLKEDREELNRRCCGQPPVHMTWDIADPHGIDFYHDVLPHFERPVRRYQVLSLGEIQEDTTSDSSSD